MSISKEREEVLKKIREFEQKGDWNKDVEKDPSFKELRPNDVDYLCKKVSTKVKRFIANKLAYSYFENQIKKGNLVIKEVKGIENFLSIKGGAFITCNHFSVMDNYAIYHVTRKYLRRKRYTRLLKKVTILVLRVCMDCFLSIVILCHYLLILKQ